MERDDLPLVVENRGTGGAGLGISGVMNEVIEIDSGHHFRIESDDLAGANGDLLRLAVRMLNDADPFAADTFASHRYERKTAIPLERDATFGKGRHRDQSEIQVAVGEKYFL